MSLPGTASMNLADLLTARALAMPDAIAAIHGDISLTLAAMESAVWKMAHHLRESGLKPGDVAGLQVVDPLLHLISTFALARTGIVHLAVSKDLSAADQNADLLRRTGAAAVISDQPSDPELLERLVRIDLVAALAGWGEADPVLRSDGGSRPLMYKSSSGTTGRPKLSGATHAGMIASIEREQTTVRYLVGERYLTPVAMEFDAPKRRYIACILSGSTAVMPPSDRVVAQLLELIDRHDIRHFSCVPGQAHAIASEIPPGRQRFPDMRCFRLSAAPSDPKLLDLLRERICSGIVVSYGCSELGPITFADSESTARRPQSVGRPMPGVTIEIASATDDPVPPGSTGIVKVRALGMPEAYVDDPEATARHFRNGWFYPGDLGALSPDGELTLMGRADDMMNFDGINIAPKEIELVLQSYAGVREAAAFPLLSRRLHQLPAAAVVLDADADLDDLIRFTKKQLGSRAPILIIAVNQMPRNPGGKILKRTLSELAENHLPNSPRKIH